MNWALKRTQQCAKCPWRKATDPNKIPDGYSVEKHAALKRTIAKEGDLSTVFAKEIRAMACHETHDAHCIGWLWHQIGPGNNIALRLHVRSCTNFDQIKLRGPQHETFEDTLPK